ncbi:MULTISPECIES: hypothetical protein [Streptomyces]|uniref:Secreted protein n=1 Tax=Streptomyces antimycoticus TaxID=68175 RepID=A0ABD5JDU1_9ACTN|nr:MULTISPECIES: hypothetical protein [Streptomyces]MEE4585947.1 hypothetical protein [Streptomyces sp. DSM 41602]QTI87801.1 hypothetical protein AS97_43535 [Streptomyces sp. AgN23]WTA80042.1 hypothetical protein OG751_08690 [Streptomyces antimycoticus]
MSATSRRNRARAVSLAATFGSITFSATSTPVASCRARYTAPMPPRPSSRITE